MPAGVQSPPFGVEQRLSARAAGAATGDSVAIFIQQPASEIEAAVGVSPILGAGMFGEPIAAAAEVGADAERVGQGPRAVHPLDHPPPADRFQHIGLARVGDDEAVVVVEPVQVAAVAALAVALQQGGHHLDGLGRARATLETQPHQVHADQGAAAGGGNGRVHRFVADHHPMLVGAHLRAPHPERAAEQAGVGLRHLRSGDVGELERRPRHASPARSHLDQLRFVALAVAVLGEQDPAAGRRVAQGDQGVAHGFPRPDAERYSHPRSTRKLDPTHGVLIPCAQPNRGMRVRRIGLWLAVAGVLAATPALAAGGDATSCKAEGVEVTTAPAANGEPAR